MPKINKEKTLEREIRDLKDKLLHLAMATNNVLMEGSFTGDMTHHASELMRVCMTYADNHNKEQEQCEK